MASIPQFYSDYTFPTDLSDFNPPIVAGVSDGAAYGGPMWSQESLVPLFDNGFLDDIVSQTNITSSVGTSSFPGQLGTSDLAVPTLFDSKMDLCSMVGIENFGGGYQPNVCRFGENCCGFLDDYRSVHPAARENWGIQGNQHAIEESNMKVGRYSKEEKKERILRYLNKRNQRNFNKTIKYACRKTLADRRVRVRGRFARNGKLCEEERAMKKTNDPYKEESCCSDAIQIKTDEDDWLQEALTSLMYLPYISGWQGTEAC